MKKKKIFFITYKKPSKNTAGSKAPDDIASICRQCGFNEVFMPPFPQDKCTIYKKLWLMTRGVFSWIKLYNSIPKGAVVFYQHPSYGYRIIIRFVDLLKKRKNCKFVALIHDLESLRGGIAGVINARESTNHIGDDVLLKKFDYIICHNEKMKQYLIDRGFSADRLICLEIFDYLNDCDFVSVEKDPKASIAIAGNLAVGKCEYIYKICENQNNSNLTINLFGINYDESRASQQMDYHGSFKPDELPSYLKGRYGLVWDGTSSDSCVGNTGEYLKYNNPHKTSLYLSSGMPVIIWDKAALSSFVKKNNVGITVSSLNDLDNALNSISEEEYDKMVSNTRIVAEKIRNGQYFKAAFKKAICKIKDLSYYKN